jgi:peptide deformylase
MATLDILTYPDPRLRERCRPVGAFDDGLRSHVADLIETMHASRAIGLSAPQVGDTRQILVVDLSEDQSAPEVFINPQLVTKLGFGFVQESCLSVPGVERSVGRAMSVRVSARDVHGRSFERELEGMAAVAVQHEMDHLCGKLFIDRLSWLRRYFATRSANAHAAADHGSGLSI